MKKELFGKILLLTGVLLTASAVLLPIGYQIRTEILEGEPCLETEDMMRSATVDKYESAEEIAEYVLYQIHQGDLDLALRGCAIEEVAENFSLQSYEELLQNFAYSATMAPSDFENTAYTGINQAKLTAVYSDMLEQCMESLGPDYDLTLTGVYADIPEDADGYYYQAIRDICAVVGARDACNVVLDMTVEGVPRRMTVTAVRYGGHWKLLQFSAYQNYEYTEPQISEFTEDPKETELPLSWDGLEDARLSVNYKVLGTNSEEDIETLIRNWFVYLQRGDVWKAAAYYDFCAEGEGTQPDSLFFAKQNQVMTGLQDIYYRILLHNADQANWALQNLKEEAVNLVSMLDASQMLYTRLYTVDIQEDGDGQATCTIGYSYDKAGFKSTVSLIYRDGWRISDIS